jgi:Domain of unknown function (DUF4440)
MNKYFVRLFVAFGAFVFSLFLTNLTMLWRGNDPSIETVVVEQPLVVVSVGADESQIRQIYSEYGPAQTRHDRAFFERVETDDFILFVGSERLTREQDILWMENQPLDMVYEAKVKHISLTETSAVAHGIMGVRYGDGHVEEWPFIDVWVKRGDVWQIRSTTSN